MFTLFSRIILSNYRSLIVLFLVILFASTGFITLRQTTTNIESLVASETRPLFGADLIVSPRGYATGDILPLIAPMLAGESYRASERREFSTTLLDQSGKTGLIKIVAYSGSYPQRGILKIEKVEQANSGVNPLSQGQTRVAVTPGVIDRFSSGGIVTLDGVLLTITDRILESSDLGFSLGTDNQLIVLPSELLSGSLLLSSGSRLDQDLYISFDDERRADAVALTLKKILPDVTYRIRTYTERTENTLETVETLTDYITLILLVASIFAFVILRSAHESFYESLARTLRVTEILGLTRTRQRLLLLMLYGVIFPLAFVLSIGLSDIIIELIRRIPEASEFQFFWSALLPAFLLLLFIVVMAWFPVWWSIGAMEEGGVSAGKSSLQKKIEQLFGSLGGQNSRFGGYLLSVSNSIFRLDILIQLGLGIAILLILFGDIVFSLVVVVGAGLFFLVFALLLQYLYGWIYARVTNLRLERFSFYDGIRALVRPLTPTIPITISLVSVTVFSLVFATFSVAFRSQLVIDSTGTANIYAINILDTDREKVEQFLGSGALMYDILRARVTRINNESLEAHLGVDKASGEFTREFNITTSPLENKILKGKKTIGKGEVSVDGEFASRLGVKMGDRIEFLLSGRSITLTLASIRESVREGFRPFFYFSFDLVEFANAPHTYFVAEYASDTELWKRGMLAATGPHVTFIDIESILTIVRDISAKVLSVIGLFFAVVFLFAIGAIIAFFSRMQPIEDAKSRLYSLFGASPGDINTSLTTTRRMIFVVSYILSIIIGGILSYFVLSIGGFFQFSYLSFALISGVTGIIYAVLALILRPNRN